MVRLEVLSPRTCEWPAQERTATMSRRYYADLILPSLLCVLAIFPRPVVGAGRDLARAPSASLRLFVDADATGANSGATWTDAYRDLQDALVAARRSGGTIREIWVAAGTYRPDRRTGNRTASFCLLSGVAIYGGFAGGETHLAQRNIETNETLLSGDLAGNDGPGFTNNGENSYHVVMSTGTVTRAVLDGFTIASGNANDESSAWWMYAHGFGGGLLNSHGSPSVVNVTFRHNAAAKGGGMCNWGGAPVVANCTFIGNAALRHAGALLNEGTDTEFFCNLKFFGNTAGSIGGAIWNSEISAAFVNCAFSGNTAGGGGWGGGGAVWNVAGDGGTWINCTFSGNEVFGLGGAILTDFMPNLVNCIFWNNHDGNNAGETAQIHVYIPGAAVIEHNCIQGWTGAWGGSGNFGLDPRLADADGPDGVAGTFDDDLRLRPGSPCQDAGDNAALPRDGFDLDGDGDTTEPIPLDLVGNPRTVNRTVDMGAYEYAPPAGLHAHIRILPRTLNLKSRGRWITCYIELPEPHNVGDIDVGSLLLNDRVHAAARPATVGDYDGDGIPDLMVKFPRHEVIAILGVGERVEITITGQVAGNAFQGSDLIRVINPGLGPKSVAPGQRLEFSIACLAEGLTGRISYSGENLPAGSTLDARTGQFSWTPTPEQAGVYQGVVFQATNGLDEVVESITITVEITTNVRPATWTLYR